MKYPIGIQSFQKLREKGYVYVDKTRYIHSLVSSGEYFFLSRPRRFGKSLLMSTIEAYFSGRRDLFEGLAISELTDEWEEYPVFHFDFVGNKLGCLEDLELALGDMLLSLERQYSVEENNISSDRRFGRLIENVYRAYNKPIVILVDEYDRALIETIDKPAEQEKIRSLLRAFYGNLKGYDEYLKFGMLTGVTRFSKVSIFSDLNNLKDISMLDEYSGICGITTDELHTYFSESIAQFAEAKDTDTESLLQKLKEEYDGYHFSARGVDVYNPFSLLNALGDKEINSYWFMTGTPTFLVQLLQQADFNLSRLQDVEASAIDLSSTEIITRNPVAIMYQSGYLTIKHYDQDFNVYELSYPNREVKRGFIEFLLPYYANPSEKSEGFSIRRFVGSLRTGDVGGFMTLLESLFAGYSYEVILDCENHYQNVVYLLFTLLGYYTDIEKRTSFSRSDLVVKTADFIYIFEFKYDGTADEALAQIKEKEYAAPYAADLRKKIGIGVNFSPSRRKIDGWGYETL